MSSLQADLLAYEANRQRHNSEVAKHVGAAEGAEQRVKDNLGFVATIVDPLRSTLVQPSASVGGANSFPQVISYNTTYNVKTKVTPAARAALNVDKFIDIASDMPETQTGMFMHLPQEGVDAIYHMSPVMGSTSTFVGIAANGEAFGPANIQAANGLNIAGHIVAAPQGVAPDTTFNPAFVLQYKQPVWLPRAGLNNAVTVAPELDKKFSRCRLFTGIIQVYGSAIAAGAFQLTGTLNTSAIADTRDISSALLDSNEYTSYSSADLQQQCISQKDALQDVKMEDGIVSLVGPDFPQRYGAPTQFRTDTLAGEFARFKITNYPILPINLNIPTVTEVPKPVCSVWISPVASNFWVANGNSGSVVIGDPNGGVAPNYHNVIQTSPINETGTLDVQVKIQWSANASEVNNNNSARLRGSITYIWASIDNNNLVSYSLVSERFVDTRYLRDTMWTRHYTSVGGPGLEPAFVYTADSSRMNRPQNAKLLGVYVSMCCNWGESSDNSPATINITSIDINVRARNVDSEGRVGPAHIIQYQDVAVGQNIQLNGKMGVQCVAQGDSASLVQPFISDGRSTADQAATSLVYILFKSNDMCARFYRRNWYMNHVLPWVRGIQQPEQLLVTSAPEGQGSVGSAMSSAGLLEGLGGALGGLAGSVLGMPTLGAQAGSLLGSVGDSAFGTSGQFRGAYNSAGAFGASGQFGGSSMSAGGMYANGAMRRQR